jgi:hypothetical protein
MQNTPGVTNLTDLVFAGCTGLTYLNMESSGLTGLQSSWFAGAPNIRFLYVARNLITRFKFQLGYIKVFKEKMKLTLFHTLFFGRSISFILTRTVYLMVRLFLFLAIAQPMDLGIIWEFTPPPLPLPVVYIQKRVIRWVVGPSCPP